MSNFGFGWRGTLMFVAFRERFQAGMTGYVGHTKEKMWVDAAMAVR